MNPNIFFSNFSGASGISRQTPGISRQKSLIPWVSRDIPNFLAPTHSRGRPPPHQKISGLKSLGLGSFFVPDFFLFCANFGRCKTFKILLKSAGQIFLSGPRGANNFSVAFQIVFRILFRVFRTVFRIDLKVFRGQFRSADMPP